MLTTAALALVVNAAVGIYKWLVPRVGRAGIQIIAFVIALAAALYQTYSGAFPSVEIWVKSAIGIFCVAVAFYEVIWTYLPSLTTPGGVSSPS